MGKLSNMSIFVTKSLQMILEDIVEVARERNPTERKNITAESTLIWLRSTGLVSIKRLDGRRVFVASPRLIDRYEMGDGPKGLAKRKKAEIRLDRSLRGICEQVIQIKKSLGLKPRRRKIITKHLPLLELSDRAFVYTDAEGHLAWKASPSP